MNFRPPETLTLECIKGWKYPAERSLLIAMLKAYSLSLAKAFLKLCALLACLIPTMAQRSFFPFPSGDSEPKVRNTYNKTFDLSKMGGIGREETLAMFYKIWNQYRLTHELEADGTFTESDSAKTPDTLEAKARFYAFVKARSPEIKLIEKQTCPNCSGAGSIVDPNGQSYECPTCNGRKQLATIYNFSMQHTGELSPAVTKYLPKNGSGVTAGSPGGSPAGEVEGQLRAAVEKHLSELLASKLTGKSPMGFGVSNAGFSAPGRMWQLDLQFKNAELLKATGATVRITFFETGNRSSPNIVARADAKIALDSEDKGSVPFSAFSYPELDGLKASKNSMEAFGDYSLVLKQIKRADMIMIKVLSITPTNAQKAIDIDKESFWRIQRPDATSPGQTSAPSQAPDGSSNKSRSYGSGMVFTSEGHLFTNYHVIAKATSCYVVVYENGQLTRKLPATIVSKDPKSDLVILQCKEWKPAAGSHPTPPPVVSSSQCKLGSQVFVLGFPLPGTVSSNVKYTKGDVSDMAGLDDDSSKIQHTAQIQPGNSGGPMALADGRVIGIIVSSLSEGYALRTSGALPQGVNFSIKSDYLMTLASIAGVEIPKNAIGPEAIEHVKAYTVQIMCEK